MCDHPFIKTGCCVIIQTIEFGCSVIIQPLDILGCCVIILVLYGFRPLRNRGRVIWKSKDASLRVRDLVRPITANRDDVGLCLSCGEICTPLQS
jgi:hypothetical protein